ncbi:MAG: hypothetical protein A3G39_02000 [Deltaproteobacteria bacterium RIFCSPLOWO2_12_FULL_43_16]|nr:MAG: hypothetical protein A2Z89_03075 [Deltaproteobacteria bacterium GWA2_43_19]OGQ12907.1 MAG: hypothetical protein A3D30_04765 [Deltaproteobacteria bacterium RIFCSPHIGHO2_02_FULL_43_33]OGQ38001.1 MAG: hypothetical protein A3A85_08880 [Deltaproteobacteria bacterium RIFCSPLOWO2_01_FULL_42_9]OGQ57184.1 MAG: hypothetical protein A3G39_02000 [Deltaproteobacteria bacterium RIFCSPLOWO2_12_FULL_43_16]HBR17266.1 hypothetical protein [Deltaproteobacteria bacterium]
MIILTKIKSINWQAIRENKLYRRFASLKTSVILLGILIGFYIVGTIFPQGGQIDDYIKAGGRFTPFVIFFNLLNIFTAPGFLLIALLLFINLFICTVERFLLLLNQRANRADGLEFIPAYTFPLDINRQLEDAHGSIKEIFIKDLGFKAYPYHEETALIDGSARIVEKGWSYKWLTWGYHLAILFCFFGFLLTYLFSFEDEIILYPGEAAAIKPATISRWNKSWGHQPQELDFKLQLDEFITEYNQFPVLDYPNDKLSRLAMAMGWNEPKYFVKNESYFPKDWKSRLKVIEGNKTVLEKTIEVNDPLYYHGTTFYQAAYKQNLKIQVDDNPILLETDTDNELMIPGIEGMFRFGTIKTGTLFKKDGSQEKIKSFVDATLVKKDSAGKTETEKIGKLEQDGSLIVDNKKIILKEVKEASILSYRSDPGVPILWWAGVMALLAMSLRVFGAWYRIIYRIEEREDTPYLSFTIKTKGLMADEEKLIRRLKHLLENMTEPIDLDTPV